VREIDHIEQAENHGKTQRQHCIKRPVNQTQQQLAQHGLKGNAEYFHGRSQRKISPWTGDETGEAVRRQGAPQA
jgi:hypothetical protein